jgi:hypothetical protein
MATPVYNPGWNAGWRHGGGGFGHGGGHGNGRTWGVVVGNGSMLGGNTPQYLGAGQPAAEGGSGISFFGNGTPVYVTAPSMGAGPTSGVTPSVATAPQPAPQPGQVAIVVPRS